MKASETSERYEGKLRECCNYAARTAKNFATSGNNSKRQACGPDEKLLADTLKEDLTGFCDTVNEENFSADRAAYILSNLLIFIFMILSAAAAICACMFPDYSKVLLIVALVLAFLSLLGFFGVFGGTSKNVDGQNIYAVRKPEGDAKKRVIIEANLDAPFRRNLSPKKVVLLKTITLIGIILYFVFDIVAFLILKDQLEFFASKLFIYISFPLALFAFIPLALSRSVKAGASFPGVVDNLVGCYTAAGALRYMSEMDLRLKNTELCVLLTGAKNADCAGARDYCRFHAEDDAAVATTVISLDSIFNADTITVLSSGKGTTDALATAASNAEVTILSTVPKYIKKNGSMRIFKKNKYSCATVTSLGETYPAYFSTEMDNEENINVKAIESAMKIVLEAAYALDE
ncbi:MAG: M28 family peptidase [Clostridia bacterium]|nr:M28 family peptidase [Clostridia bacterium]MBR6479255.1 M28 family peptidase [Clostridia bacterium]MBR6513170.1 M28 family peptidase [Clostridia bacterium]